MLLTICIKAIFAHQNVYESEHGRVVLVLYTFAIMTQDFQNL